VSDDVRTSAGVPAGAIDEPELEPRVRDGLRDTVWVFLGVRTLLFVLSAVGVGLIPLPFDQPTSVPGWPARPPDRGWEAVFTATERQDALWYLRLATDGYREDDLSAAFFPMYPAIVRTVALVPGVGPLGAALLVSNAAAFGALLMLHALTRLELGRAAARRTILFIALFPTAFFLLSPYSESLFLLLSVSAFWFGRRDRWGWAAVLGASAALTRSVGVLLLLGLGAEALRQWRSEGRSPLPRLTAAAAVILGPLLYGAYWLAAFGNVWAPLDAQRAWQRQTSFFLLTVWRAVDAAWDFHFYYLLDVLVVAFAIAGVALAVRHVASSYSVYAIASILLPLTFPFPDRPLLSMPRFVLVVFPAFWGFAAVAARRPGVATAVVAGGAAGYGVLTVLFVNWHYIF
jgi:hypothetical protein